ncbi:MAG: hypothetical protein GEU87_12030 [Alphaproteobacteria bacterium]|nr:hypothetical protein [Alphaproteobacteria bacterium]
MPRLQNPKCWVVCVFACFGLAACADFGARYPITSQVPPGQGMIRFADSSLANARQVRVSHLGAMEHVEYARFETDDAILEAVYDVALNVSLVLEYDYWMSRMTDTWNANRSQAKSWGPVQSVAAWHGKIAYQPYRLTSSGRDCAAFSSDWDYQPRDSRGRPSRVFFGYLCAKPGRQLTDQGVASLLGSVSFPTSPVEALVPVNGQRSTDRTALAAAKGAAGSSTGNAKFPFNFGTTYFDGGDNSRSP